MGEKAGEAKGKTEESVFPEDDIPVFVGPKQGEEIFGRPEREKAGFRRENGLPDQVWPEEAEDLDDAGELAGGFDEDYNDDLHDEPAERAVPIGENWLGQQLHDPGTLRTLLALAHVLKRPDGKTTPWQRRL